MATNTITVGLFTPPVVGASSVRPKACKGEKITITASGADTYTWTNMATTQINNTVVVVSPVAVTQHTYNVTGTDANGCKGSAAITVTVNACQGVAGFNAAAGVKIYPNPNNGEFTIEGTSAAHAQIFNAAGQLVQVIVLEEKNGNKALVKGLSNGIYFITVGDQIKMQKVIIYK
jgi:hypothetical protein